MIDPRHEVEITIHQNSVRISSVSQTAVEQTLLLVRKGQYGEFAGGAATLRLMVEECGMIETIRWLRANHSYGLREAKELLDAITERADRYGQS